MILSTKLAKSSRKDVLQSQIFNKLGDLGMKGTFSPVILKSKNLPIFGLKNSTALEVNFGKCCLGSQQNPAFKGANCLGPILSLEVVLRQFIPAFGMNRI